MKLFVYDEKISTYTCNICNDKISYIVLESEIQMPFYGMKKHLKDTHNIIFKCIHGEICPCDKQIDISQYKV